jgi:hypothetical protein
VFTDPIVVTRNAIANNLPRINNDNFQSVYLKDTALESLQVNIRHSNESAKAGVVALERHNFELVHTTYATTTVPARKEIVSFTVRRQKGDDPADALLTAKAVIAFLTDANITKLVAWES